MQQEFHAKSRKHSKNKSNFAWFNPIFIIVALPSIYQQPYVTYYVSPYHHGQNSIAPYY